LRGPTAGCRIEWCVLACEKELKTSSALNKFCKPRCISTTGNEFIVLCTAEHATSSYRPVLTILYTVPGSGSAFFPNTEASISSAPYVDHDWTVKDQAKADDGVGDREAAFTAARLLNPDSREPADGLLQVDQEVRLADIRRLEDEAMSLDRAEQWEASITTYEDILKIDPDLQFAKDGLAAARSRAAIHSRLQGFIDDPDNLSDDANMQNATRLLLDVTRLEPMGPRLVDQKSELARLLKRAATPLRVQLVSDNQTDVSVFRIGRFGSFSAHELELRPGNYVAVGIRPGYRDVRIEFRVAPEIDMQPIVVQCEEII